MNTNIDSPDCLTTLSIETASRCNLQCRMCSHPLSKRKPHIMSFEDFRIIIDKLSGTKIKRLSFNMGEPFMNKSIFRMISYAVRKGFFVYISTNGLLLTEDYINNVLKTGVNALKFSIEGYAPEVYKNIRIGGDFDRLFRNVVRMKELRDRNESKLYIWISTILMKGNENIVEFVKFWGPYCDEIEYAGLSDHIGIVDNKDISLAAEWHTRKSCPQVKPFQELNVLSSGDVVICCVDFLGQCVLGNLLEQDFEEIWLSEKMKDIRQKADSDNLGDIDPCRNCSMANYSSVFGENMRNEVSFLHEAIKNKNWNALNDIQWVDGTGTQCLSCGKPLKISFAGFCSPCLQKKFGKK